MDKCRQILKQTQEQDLTMFFAKPVDTVALNLPTYHQIISRPMDLGTIEKKLDAKEISSPEEFGKLVRLVFENAMAFNIEPTHPVHAAARSLLINFNQKFRDIERTMEGIRRFNKPSEAEAARIKKEREEETKSKKKGDKKRRKPGQGGISKKARLEEAQSMAQANAAAMAQLVGSAPSTATSQGSVTRAEFNMLLQMIQQLQGQVVRTLNAVATLSPAVEPDDVMSASASGVDNDSIFTPQIEPARGPNKKGKKKAPTPKAAPRTVNVEEQKPLSFKEQEDLTLAINELPQDRLQAVIEIIRESTHLGDEEEIDLEIDQLDTATQRKLLRYVNQVSYARPRKQRVSFKGMSFLEPAAHLSLPLRMLAC
jgi:bromodomain-containing factor 1